MAGSGWSLAKMKSPVLFQPRSLEEAWELKRKFGANAIYIAGSTLLRTQWEAGTAALPEVLIDLREVEGLSGIHFEEDSGELYIGALTDLSACRRSGEIEARTPSLREAARVIAAPSIRNLATLGGNIACGYGDTLPALLVVDARLEVYEESGSRLLPIADWLEQRWGGTDDPDTILTGVRITVMRTPSEDDQRFEAYRKVGRREAFTPSLVTVALSGTISVDGNLSSVRIAAGGGSGRPVRLRQAESLLEGSRWSQQLLPQLCELIETEYTPSSDAFATASYKKKTAVNIIAAELWRLFGERGRSELLLS